MCERLFFRFSFSTSTLFNIETSLNCDKFLIWYEKKEQVQWKGVNLKRVKASRSLSKNRKKKKRLNSMKENGIVEESCDRNILIIVEDEKKKRRDDWHKCCSMKWTFGNLAMCVFEEGRKRFFFQGKNQENREEKELRRGKFLEKRRRRRRSRSRRKRWEEDDDEKVGEAARGYKDRSKICIYTIFIVEIWVQKRIWNSNNSFILRGVI